MDDDHQLARLARDFLAGSLTAQEFRLRLLQAGSQWMGSVTLDLDRGHRCGFPEVVYAQGKTDEDLLRIAEAYRQRKTPLLMTRLAEESGRKLVGRFPAGKYNPLARTFRLEPPAEEAEVQVATDRPGDAPGRVAVVSAGTTDRPVAEEARETLAWMGVPRFDLDDVGVAGPQRLLAHLDPLRDVDAVVVVAGMEGALPSLVGGLVPCPVVAVPTDVGYGASLGGLTPLLSMLSSCAANVTVVNINAGFKAGYIAGLIAYNRTRRRHGSPSSNN